VPDLTRTLARYAADLRYDDLPAPIVQLTKDVIQDQLACQLACSQLDQGKIAIDYARAQAGPGVATVIGAGFKTGAEHAALVNGIQGHGDEIDGSLPKFGHACAVLLPAVLAVGEREHASGRDLITGLVLGYEFAGRLARAGLSLDVLAPRNFHQSSVAGSLAAAAAAGKLLGLSTEQYQAALGLGADQACGLQAIRTESGHMNKSFHMGVGSRNGIAAADLARLGYGGVLNVLDEPHSIFEAFSTDQARPQALVEKLGDGYEISAARFKRYASGSPTHSAIASMLAILSEHELSPADIDVLEVRLPTLEQQLLTQRATLNISLEYIIAVAALDGEVSWDQYTDERRADPVLQDLLGRVSTRGDAEMDVLKNSDPLARPAEVELRTRDGRTFTQRMAFPPGSPRNPLSREELDEKFRFWSTKVIPAEQAERLRNTVQHLDELADVNELGDLLRID
jgi:2-methylcitrate dehydratase PrpD